MGNFHGYHFQALGDSIQYTLKVELGLSDGVEKGTRVRPQAELGRFRNTNRAKVPTSVTS